MNVMNDVAEARASALSLRASAKACTPEQGALKFRLTRAAESLDAMVLLAMRGLNRIEELEQQLKATAPPADTPSSPVPVSGVDVAPLALADRVLHTVPDEMEETPEDDGARERLEALMDAVSDEIGQLHKTHALLICAQYTANYGDVEVDISDAIAVIMERVEQSIATLDRVCTEAAHERTKG